MSSRGYTALGWVVWQIGTRVLRRKLRGNRAKLAAAATAALIAAAGIALAAGDDDDE